jgi:hypothetical protein
MSRMLLRHFLLSLALLVAPGAIYAGVDDGQPFGTMGEKQFSAFVEYATSHGVDLEAEMKKAYAGDAAALARVFGLASGFKSLDAQAKAYGNLLYSTFLNIVERQGDGIFVSAIALLPESEWQRVRDFLFYPVRLAPRKHRAEVERETREQFPKLYPPEYEFGKNDALFN